MGTARRLYIYIVSAVSLLALTAGIGSLLTTLLREIEDALDGSTVVGGWDSREQLSLAIALIAVGGPIWAIHWWLARRGLQAPGARGDEERASGVRAWYVALVQAVALAAWMTALIGLLGTMLTPLFGSATGQTWSDSLAVALVAVPVWVLFARTRAAEIRATRMEGSAAWFTRLYRYGGAFAAMMVLLAGASGLIATVLSALIGQPGLGLEDRWWSLVVPGQVAQIIVGLGAWLLHWRDAGAAIRDAGIIGEDDRVTRLRATYFGGVLLVATSVGAFITAGALADLGRWILGVNAGDALAFLEDVAGPPLAAIPFVVAGAWHARFAGREAAALGETQAVSTRRNGLLLVALVGLAFLATGSVQVLDLAFSQVAGAGEPSLNGDSGAMRQLPWYLAQLIVGTVLWLPGWAGILSMRAHDLRRERAATVTRAYLFLVFGASVVAAVPTATMTLYRLLDTFLGGRPAQPLLAELSFPVAVVIVAVVVGAYHGWLLLGDIRAAGPVPAAEVAVAADQGIAPVAPVAPVATVASVAPVASVATVASVAPVASAELAIELTVHAPPGTDAAALVAGLREHLPAGTTLEEHDGAGSGLLAAAR